VNHLFFFFYEMSELKVVREVFGELSPITKKIEEYLVSLWMHDHQQSMARVLYCIERFGMRLMIPFGGREIETCPLRFKHHIEEQ